MQKNIQGAAKAMTQPANSGHRLAIDSSEQIGAGGSQLCLGLQQSSCAASGVSVTAFLMVETFHGILDESEMHIIYILIILKAHCGGQIFLTLQVTRILLVSKPTCPFHSISAVMQ